MVSHTSTPERTIIPPVFNAAAYFVDRHVIEGRGGRLAIVCGDERLTYAEVHERVNRIGNALRDRLGVRAEERVALLLQDGWEFACVFFGAIKIGAVPVPLNTLWKPADYEHVLADCAARVAVVSESLLTAVLSIPAEKRRGLRHLVAVGAATATADGSLARLMEDGAPALDAESTNKDAPAFWLYSSGSTGMPKGCVHLQHDMPVCADLYARGVLGLTADDRCFSVAKLFF